MKDSILASTRSIGDAVAKDLGVVAEPECADFPIPPTGAIFILGIVMECLISFQMMRLELL